MSNTSTFPSLPYRVKWQRAKPSDVAGASLLPLPSSRAEAAVTGDSLFASRPAVVLCTRRPG